MLAKYMLFLALPVRAKQYKSTQIHILNFLKYHKLSLYVPYSYELVPPRKFYQTDFIEYACYL